VPNFVVSCVLIFGAAFVSYLPQFLKIHRAQSHVGLSLINWSCSATVNTLMMIAAVSDGGRDDIACCSDAASSTFECLSSLLVLVQQAVQTVCAQVIIVLYVLNFDGERVEQTGEGNRAREWRKTRAIAGTMVAVEAASGVAAIVLGHSWPHLLGGYGRAASMTASALVTFHWGFQIRETHRVQSPGALSMFSLCVQTLGCGLTAFEYSKHGGWAVWAPYVFSATMIGACTLQCLWLEKRAMEACEERGAAGEEEQNADQNGGYIATAAGTGMDDGRGAKRAPLLGDARGASESKSKFRRFLHFLAQAPARQEAPRASTIPGTRTPGGRDGEDDGGEGGAVADSKPQLEVGCPSDGVAIGTNGGCGEETE
jgi:hypothetical protein